MELNPQTWPWSQRREENPEEDCSTASAKKVSQQVIDSVYELLNGCCFTSAFIEISHKQEHTKKRILENVAQLSQVDTLQSHCTVPICPLAAFKISFRLYKI